MRFLLTSLALFAGIVSVSAGDDWKGGSSIAAQAAIPPSSVTNAWGTDPVDQKGCSEDVKGTNCCVKGAPIHNNDPPNDFAYDYGQCDNSGAHNCPGGTKKTCTAGLNGLGNGSKAASCPAVITGTNPPIYPRCQLASQDCQDHVRHCWGVIKCFLNPDGTNPTPCPSTGWVDNSEPTHPVTYAENDFCFEDGQSGVTDWCGACPQGFIEDVNGNCVTTCDGPLDNENVCCPPPYDIIDGLCCQLLIHQTNPDACRAPAGPQGDPQIGGFHGQSFQFHGLADEVFNLISTPTLQVNGHFVYLSSGKCDYNDTMCWSHPGTYIDQLGYSFGSHRVKLIAGTHQVGLQAYIDDEKVNYGNYQFMANGTNVAIKFHHHGRLIIKTHEFVFTVYNSDMFFNMEASLLDQHLLHIGSPKHTITDSTLCKKEDTVDETKFQTSEIKHKHNHGAVEAAIEKKYGGIQVPLHGLIGQTWRNVVVCGKHWVGTVTDYVASDLFASDYFFNFYHQE